MRTYVHFVEGDSAAGRSARIAQLIRTSRRPVTIFAEAADPPTSPLDWLMGPGCTCCLPAAHPRLRLIQAVTRVGQARIIIDAGPAAVADRIAATLGSLPMRVDLNTIRS
ncbi:MAG: hypothetical protein HC844_00145 [Tabrizicola sp.]|nr:hypothetical protein [Tabrizicola sp.]